MLRRARKLRGREGGVHKEEERWRGERERVQTARAPESPVVVGRR